MSAVNILNQIPEDFQYLLDNFSKTFTVPNMSNALPCKSASQITSHHIYPAHWYYPAGNRPLVFPSKQPGVELGKTVIIGF